MRVRCLYDDYLKALEYVREIGETVFEQTIWPHRQAFLERGWIRIAGYFEGQTIEGDDGWVAEVDHEIDLEAGVYRYPNPNWRGSTVVRPIEEITFYALCIERFLNDLSTLMGIDSRHRPGKSEVVHSHLWEMGQVQVGTTQQWARIFIARLNHANAYSQIKNWLDDEVCPGQSILLVHKVSNPSAFGDHVERCLSDLLDVDAGLSLFRADKLQRILKRNAAIALESGPSEYIEANLLELAHFAKPMNLSPALARIVKQCWGAPDKLPPIVSWAETNEQVNTGYVSFDDAFGSQEARELIFALVKRGKYRLRRAENSKNHKSTINAPINFP